jgi:hypothetical protein
LNAPSLPPPPHPNHPPALALNATLVAQIVIYGNKGVKKAPATKKAVTKKRA